MTAPPCRCRWGRLRTPISQALLEKNDLGIHTQYVTNTIMKLMAMGVVTNRKKGFNNGKIICSNAIGTKDLYDLLDNNSAVEFHPSKYVNDPRIISQNNKMVAMNIGKEIDLTGQVAADALAFNNFSGVTGIVDFFRGASMSNGGKSILMLTSTRNNDRQSRIVPMLQNSAVVVPRGEVQYVVTEYGSVNLFGKSIQERAIALISIAHPNFRDSLFEQAKETRPAWPRALAQRRDACHLPTAPGGNQDHQPRKLTFRPVKLTDERPLQEHYYGLDKIDVVSRFFHEKTSFVSKQIERTFIIDYSQRSDHCRSRGRTGLRNDTGGWRILHEPGDQYCRNRLFGAEGLAGHGSVFNRHQKTCRRRQGQRNHRFFGLYLKRQQTHDQALSQPRLRCEDHR